MSEQEQAAESVLLVVASKVKARAKAAGASASAESLVVLTKLVEKALDAAVEKAKADGRKVVKPRDFE